MIAVGIAVYNELQYVKITVNSVFENAGGSNVVAYLFNNYKPGTAEYKELPEYVNSLRKQGKDIYLLGGGGNIGFGAAHNIMYRKAFESGAEYFICLNDDMHVGKDYDKQLMSVLDGKIILSAPADGAGIMEIREKQGIIGNICHPEDAQYAWGCCFMVNKLFYNWRGDNLFDPGYAYGYYEDSDLGLWLESKGFQIGFAEVECKHMHVSCAFKKREFDMEGYHVRNMARFIRKWGMKYETGTFDRNVLVIRNGGIGDVLQATGVIHEYKRLYPKDKIYFAVERVVADTGILTYNKDIFKVLCIEDRTAVRFAKIFILSDAYEGKQINMNDAYAYVMGVEMRRYNPILNIPETMKVDVPDVYVSFHFAAGHDWGGRNMPVEKWQKVINLLKEETGLPIVLIGKGEGEFENVIDMRDSSLLEAALIVKKSLIHLDVDCGVFHIAQAFDKPCVCLFGCTKPDYYTTSEKVVQITAPGVACQGCHHIVPAFSNVKSNYNTPCFRQQDKDACMLNMDEEHVVSEAVMLIESLTK